MIPRGHRFGDRSHSTSSTNDVQPTKTHDGLYRLESVNIKKAVDRYQVFYIWNRLYKWIKMWSLCHIYKVHPQTKRTFKMKVLLSFMCYFELYYTHFLLQGNYSHCLSGQSLSTLFSVSNHIKDPIFLYGSITSSVDIAQWTISAINRNGN